VPHRPACCDVDAWILSCRQVGRGRDRQNPRPLSRSRARSSVPVKHPPAVEWSGFLSERLRTEGFGRARSSVRKGVRSRLWRAVEDLVFTALTGYHLLWTELQTAQAFASSHRAAMHGFNELGDLESLRKSTSRRAVQSRMVSVLERLNRASRQRPPFSASIEHARLGESRPYLMRHAGLPHSIISKTSGGRLIRAVQLANGRREAMSDTDDALKTIQSMKLRRR